MKKQSNDDIWPYMHKVQDRYNELGFKLSFAMTCHLAMREQELETESEPAQSECFYCQGSGTDELDEMGVCKPCHGKGFE